MLLTFKKPVWFHLYESPLPIKLQITLFCNIKFCRKHRDNKNSASPLLEQNGLPHFRHIFFSINDQCFTYWQECFKKKIISTLRQDPSLSVSIRQYKRLCTDLQQSECRQSVLSHTIEKVKQEGKKIALFISSLIKTWDYNSRKFEPKLVRLFLQHSHITPGVRG